MNRYFYFIIAVVFIAGNALATPSITSVSKTTTTISISGSDFGTKSTATPIKYDGFEWGDDGDKIDTGDDPVDPKWQAAGTGGSEIDTGDAHSGAHSVYKELYPNVSPNYDQAFYDSYIEVTDTKQLYVSYWIKWDMKDPSDLDFISNGGFFKFNRINSDNTPYSGDPSLLINSSPSYTNPDTGLLSVSNYTDDQSGGTYHNYDVMPDNLIPVYGTWHRIEMWFKLSDPAGEANGDIQVFFDGVEKVFDGDYSYPWEHITVHSTAIATDINIFTLMFSAVRVTTTSYPVMWQDDVYVDNTRQRVEIGNASIWANCTHREIQLPSAWSDTSITCTLNTGSFTHNDDTYLFVVDADGNASNGYPIKLFEGYSGLGGNSHFTNIGTGASKVTFK